MGRKTKRTAIVRRSVALPAALVKEVTLAAPEEFRENFNRVVSTALWEFAQRRKELAFAASMREMANDSQVLGECARIAEEFEPAQMDGLRNGQAR